MTVLTPEAKALFTEETLSRGSMMLVGRGLDGEELGCIIYPGTEAGSLLKTVTAFHNVLVHKLGVMTIEEILAK